MLSRFLIYSSLVLVLFTAPAPLLLAQRDVWRISITRGEIQAAALSLTNNCVGTHRFRIAVSSIPPSLAGGGNGLLTFDPLMEETPIEAKSAFQAPFKIDANDVDPGTYVREIRLQCLDCSAEPDCRPTDTANRLEIEVLPVGTKINPPVPKPETVEISESPQSLSNQDILDLAKAGFGEAVILAKIGTSQCDFDTSVDALMELKSAGLSENVILAMVRTTEGTAIQSEDIPSAPSGVNPPSRHSVTVPDGTSVEIEVVQTVTSEDLTEGDVVTFRVVQPVKIGDAVVIEAGAPARARVIEVDKARHWGRSGKILWAMQDALAVDGAKIPLRFTKEAKGGGSSGKVGIAVVATAIVFWPAAPVWGLKKGKKAVVPAGQRYQVFVQGDSDVAMPGAP